MAKATIECTCPECGAKHAWSVTCYNRREADNWEQYHADEATTRLCPECYRKARNAAATAAGEAAAAANNLPALEGTEKQIAWAQSIRGKAVDCIDKADLKDGVRPYLIAAVAAHTEARWWIDNRYTTNVMAENNPLCAEAVARMSADKEDR